jgi:hypothetical protein
MGSAGRTVESQKREEVISMIYTKPEMVPLGDAARVIQGSKPNRPVIEAPLHDEPSPSYEPEE